MSKRLGEKIFGQDDPKIAEYAVELFCPEDAILAEIRTRSVQQGLPEIQVGSMDALHLEVLARAIGARKIVEIGTLGGYSGVSFLRALPKDGKLFTFEFNPHHANVAKESFKKAGFENQVEIFVGPALDNLAQIEKEGPFDLVFIDADKVSYSHYLEWAADHLRIGGVVLGDNTFAFGMIADADPRDADKRNSVKALQAFNRDIVSSGRFRATILPTGEGLTMGVKLR